MYSSRNVWGVWICLMILAASLSGRCTPQAAWGAEADGLRFATRCLMISPNEGCAIADVNRDGQPDIVAGTHWFAAPDFVPRPLRDIMQVSLGFGGPDFYANNGDHLYDVDGDGWIDVISGGWTESELCWYKNPGAWRWPKAGNGNGTCWSTPARRTRRFI